MEGFSLIGRRNSLALTVRQMARRVKVTKPTIVTYEHGGMLPPERWSDLAAGYEVPFERIEAEALRRMRAKAMQAT